MLTVIYMVICNIVAFKKERPVNYFGYSYSYVPTQSMEPTIMAGDTVIFKKCKYEDLKVGDIIVYRSKEGQTKGMYIIHRINRICDDGFEMLGDNNHGIVDDEHITKDMVMGKYIRTFNFLNIGKLASNKNIIFGLLALFFLGIIILETINIFLTQRNNALKKKKEAIKEQLLSDMKAELMKEILEEQNKINEEIKEE